MSLLKDFTDLGNFYADKGGNRPYLEIKKQCISG